MTFTSILFVLMGLSMAALCGHSLARGVHGWGKHAVLRDERPFEFANYIITGFVVALVISLSGIHLAAGGEINPGGMLMVVGVQITVSGIVAARRALKEGVVADGTFHASEQPVMFWLVAAGHAAVPLLYLSFAIFLTVEFTRLN